MRCTYYCISDAIDINELVKFLHENGYEPKIYDQAVHVQALRHRVEEKNIVCFSYGCVVFWGFAEAEELLFLDEIKSFEIEPLENRIVDNSTYVYIDESKSYINEEDDEILLGSKDILIKVSLSYGFSQSVKLTAFEESVKQTIEKTKHLPLELKEKGKTSLSKKELSQLIGALFAERNSISIHSDIMDMPEFFWRRSNYEIYYTEAAKYLDVETRLAILNNKLSVIQELYQILSSELNHIHSSKLELTVVWLIIFEIIIGIAEAWAIFKGIMH
jgi:uncharacterized Rmd1/YagE family protein